MDLLLVSDGGGDEFQATLTRENDNSAVDLTNAVVTMKVRAVGSTTTLYTMTAAGTSDQKAAGQAIFKFTSTQKDLSEGKYEGEITVTFDDGDVEKIYEKVEIYIRAGFA